MEQFLDILYKFGYVCDLEQLPAKFFPSNISFHKEFSV